MSTAPGDDHETRLRRLEDSLRRVSRRFTVAVVLLAATVLVLTTVAFTPAGPWLHARLPWTANPRLDTVSAKQFIVVDGNKDRAVFGLNPPKSANNSLTERDYPPGLAALWFYDNLNWGDRRDGPNRYRAIIGLEEDVTPYRDGSTDSVPRYQPFMLFTVWPREDNSIRLRRWP